jgi:ubiquinone/menaquinone biosynthesis C-methylase UbiE
MTGMIAPAPVRSLAAAELLPVLYRTTATYGWSRGMRAVTHALLDALPLPPGPVLEVGCGGGQLLAELVTRYPHRTVCGADLHPLGLAHAQARLPQHAPIVQSPLQRLPVSDAAFALLLALDVFDQQGVDLAAALAESRRVLCPRGYLLLRVSAHPELYGAHDRAFHTGQRYRRQTLQRTLLDQGFTVHRITYANCLVGAPVAAYRLLQRWQITPWRPGVYHHHAANALVARALQGEARWLRRRNLPIGLSLWAVAQKRGTD